MRKAELRRSLKQAKFLEAIRTGATEEKLQGIQIELDALTEATKAALERLVDNLARRRARLLN
jgi:hypothetical protein